MARPGKSIKPYKSQLRALILLLILVVVLVAALAGRPAMIRWSNLRHLADSDLAKRELALNYVVRLGRHDPAVIRGAVARLGVKDEKNFLQIVNAIDHAGQWLHPPVTDDAWLRWLAILANEKTTTARVVVAHDLAELPELVKDARVAALFERLQNDDDDDVRYAGLLAAAELSGKSEIGNELEPQIVRGTLDKTPEIARQAWIFLGLLNHSEGVEGNWRGASPRVAEAMVWEMAVTGKGKADVFEAAIGDPATPAPLRASLVYALSQCRLPPVRPMFESLLPSLLKLPREQGAIPIWRVLLASPPGPIDDRTLATCRLIQTRLQLDTPGTPSPLALVVTQRLAAWLMAHPHDGFWKTPAATQPLTLLAIDEGLEPGKVEIPMPSEASSPPELLVLTAVAATKNPDPKTLRPLFNSEASTIRDLACVVAADRFTKDQNGVLVDSLLRDLDDHGKISGAVLAGLTGVQSELLTKKMNDENVWSVQMMMKLGLWMQDRKPEMVRTAPELFVRTDIPKSTLVLVLLHQGNPAGLSGFDFLLNPRGEPPLDLVQLFDQKRWWRVVSRYLPASWGAPPFWVWADPELEQFQIDVLRDWYLINRESIYVR